MSLHDIIVAVNAGSSSIKLTVFAIAPASTGISRILDLSLSNIGQPVARLQVKHLDTPMHTEKLQAIDYETGMRVVMERLAEEISIENIVVVGHRLVHGGMKYNQPTRVEKISEEDWQLLSQLDPEHTPMAQRFITEFTHYSDAIQIACFDTAFFHELPRIAKVISLPKKYYETGVRRYGFHGLSYTSLLRTFHDKAGDVAVNGRVILAHLGSGASIAAVHSGKPVDTTMGFTPTSGLVMSTRSGDLDPNIFGFLHRYEGMDLEEFERMVSFESGLLGVSGSSGDMQELLAKEHEDEDTKIAVELFVHNIKKAIGALSATLGGIDSLIFSGGIGEQSPILRARICEGLGYLGIEIDQAMNMQNDFLISSGHSSVGVHVIPTDEAQVIATQTFELFSALERN